MRINDSGTANGTISLTSANTYTGATKIFGGVVTTGTLADGGTASGIGASTNASANLFLLGGGTLQYTGAAQNTDRLFTLGLGGTLDASGSGAVNFTNTGAMGINGVGVRTLTLTGTNTGANTLAANIVNEGANATTLDKQGAGNWTLSGASTYTGPTKVRAGVLTTASLANGGTASGIGASTNAATNLYLLGGTLQYTGAAQNTDRLFTLGLGGTLDASGSGAVNFTNTGTMGVTSVGLRTLTLTGTNTGANTLAASIVNESTNATSLTKNGAGKWILSGANTYTGVTTVNSGTLLINGSTVAASVVTVNNTGTLGGNGTISGVVTVKNGGTLAPGNSPGLLTVGSLVLEGGSTTAFEIAGTTTRGADYDAINVTTGSGLTLNGNFTIDFTNASALSNTTNINLFQYTGSYTGNFTSLVSTGFYAGTWTSGGGNFTLNSGGQTLTFSEGTGYLTVVPEPAIWALLAFSLTTVMILRRRSTKA